MAYGSFPEPGWQGPAPKRAVVIGASGGIGGAFVDALAALGSEVHALSRSGAGSCRIDLTNEPEVAAAAERVKAHGTVDLVIVASGLLHYGEAVSPEKSYRQIDPQALASVFAVNTTGPALVAKHFLPLLPRNEPARFAVLSARVGSISDNRLGGWHAYRASKAALNMLVRCFAVELARSHSKAICVALHPGTVDTPLSQPFQGNVPEDRLFRPAFAAERLLAILSTLKPEDSGGFFDWQGQAIPF